MVLTWVYGHTKDSLKVTCVQGHQFSVPSPVGWANNLVKAERYRRKNGGSPFVCPLCNTETDEFSSLLSNLDRKE